MVGRKSYLRPSLGGWRLRQKCNQLQLTENCVETETCGLQPTAIISLPAISLVVDSTDVLVVLVGASDEYTLAGGLSSDALVTHRRSAAPFIHFFPKKNKCPE